MSLRIILVEESFLFDAVITHNLNKMANEVGLYQPIWYPERNQIDRADQLVALLELGISKLEDDPTHYSQFNAMNGWGTYDDLLSWLQTLLEQCKAHPNATIEVHR